MELGVVGIPRCLDSRLTDGGEGISLTRGPPLYSPEKYFLLLVAVSARG
jgi:hypothetical protein